MILHWRRSRLHGVNVQLTYYKKNERDFYDDLDFVLSCKTIIPLNLSLSLSKIVYRTCIRVCSSNMFRFFRMCLRRVATFSKLQADFIAVTERCLYIVKIAELPKIYHTHTYIFKVLAAAIK